jgi:O-succinylbenzoate synthase
MGNTPETLRTVDLTLNNAKDLAYAVSQASLIGEINEVQQLPQRIGSKLMLDMGISNLTESQRDIVMSVYRLARAMTSQRRDKIVLNG